MSETCCMFNYGPHYRNAIYSKIDKELKYDLYFGDKVPVKMKQVDVTSYINYKKDLRNIFFKNLYWQRGVIQNLFKPYKNYIMTGDLSGISTWVVMILAKFSGKRVYLWSHGWYERDGVIKSFFRKIFFGLSFKVLLYSDYAKQLMIEHGISEDKLVPIYNSLDYDAQKKVRDKLTYSDVYRRKFENNYPTLSYIGRIQNWKRLDLLIDAMFELKQKGFPVNLVLIGEDTENTGLVKYVESRGLSGNVWFYGPTYDEEQIGKLIYNSSICVSPGNVGLTAIHSMMYGTPMITHSDYRYQGPEFEAVKEGVTGAFFKRNDSKDLANTIYEWMQNYPENDITVKKECYKIVDERYNPYYQIEVLKNQIGID